MGNYIRSFGIIFLLITILYSENIVAQQGPSELALTGRGDLILVGEKKQLQDEVYQAFLAMQKAALKDGIFIEIVSGYRSFDRQRKIWNRKYESYVDRGLTPQEAMKRIIEYSTIPGTSRHHWGTDIDIIDKNALQPENVLVEENYKVQGVYRRLGIWMDLNAENFGFVLVYTDIIGRKGFHYEPWHYSYKTISSKYLREYRKIEFHQLFETIDLKGKEFIRDEFLKKYYSENILDINPLLK